MADYYRDDAPWHEIPEYMREGIIAYVMDGRRMGGFLTALFENDLAGAVKSADLLNRTMMATYVDFLIGYVPGICWGDRRLVEGWIASGGINGQRKLHQAQDAWAKGLK